MSRYRYWAAMTLPGGRGRLVPVQWNGQVAWLWEPEGGQ
jgi:hypothetical protein